MSECVYLASSPNFQGNEIGMKNQNEYVVVLERGKEAKSRQNLKISRRYEEE